MATIFRQLSDNPRTCRYEIKTSSLSEADIVFLTKKFEKRNTWKVLDSYFLPNARDYRQTINATPGIIS